jgi:hypothetical protein
MFISFFPAAGWAGVFKDNFNDGKADGWTIQQNGAGEWKVTNGGYHGSLAEGTETIALVGEDGWQVESIEVKIRDATGEWLAVVWNYQDLNNFDSWWLSIANKTLEAWPKIGDYEGAARASVAVPFDPQKESVLTVKIEGDNFDVLWDGQKVGNYTNNKFKTGKVGLLVWAGSATFDDVIINGPNITGASIVESHCKKAVVTWGTLKAKY